MSFNENHSISLQNYEEWLILYIDNELSAAQKKLVDNFLLLHPHLQEELEVLLSTKLAAEDITFSGKEELMAPSMKLNIVDESLLLYVDDELAAAEKMAVEEKIASNTDIRLQYNLLQATKLDTSELIPYPNKKELYRHTERRIFFPVWMRIAAAAMILLTGGYFFLINAGGEITNTNTSTTAVVERPTILPQTSTVAEDNREQNLPAEEPAIAAVSAKEKTEIDSTPAVATQTVIGKNRLPVEDEIDAVAVQKIDVIKVDLSALMNEPVIALNKNVTNSVVTSVTPDTYNFKEDPEESIVTDGDDKPKRTPAKGFLRRVSRFIERRTGIGTANADNEILVGAVALKLN